MKNLFINLAFLTICNIFLSAQNITTVDSKILLNNLTSNISSVNESSDLIDSLTFTIQFVDKQIYFFNDPISIETIITNNTSKIHRLKIADHRTFNLGLDVYSINDVRQQPSRQFLTARNTRKPLFFRFIDLSPGEKFGFIVQLDQFVEIERPAIYLIEATFYPNLSTGIPANEQNILNSNTLTLNLRPQLEQNQARDITEAKIIMLPTKLSISPDEVINYTLRARQKNEWDKFFLYLDLPSILNKSPILQRTYQRSTEQDRQKLLKEYREKLQSQLLEEELALIPTTYEILKTTYTQEKATVLVDQTFKQRDFSEIRRYTYYLDRKDLIWTIVDFEVQNLGTK